jgi:hypothetical protein
LKDRKAHTARIVFQPPTLSVFLDNSAAPVLEMVVDLSIATDHHGGVLGAHLQTTFANPLVSFRLLDQNGGNLEFGFRVPVEASNYMIRVGTQWHEMGYDGSLTIDPASLKVNRLKIETDELQKETSICESSTTLEYPTGGEGVLLPSTARTRDLDRDTGETEWVTRLSGCHEASEGVPEPIPERPLPALVPPDWAVRFKLVEAISGSGHEKS